jgi:hypothetical protein
MNGDIAEKEAPVLLQGFIILVALLLNVYINGLSGVNYGIL